MARREPCGSSALIAATAFAPLWRRLLAASYDGLLLLALWMSATLVDAVVRSTLELRPNPLALRGALFLIGLGFFGWFWTHGGQTLGMRAWRLQLRRAGGQPLHWPQAMLRYTLAWFSWGLAGIGLFWCLLDPRRRALHDIASGTEMILLPRAQRAEASR